ncbi:hypothetical protein ACE6H2_002338 [Prunus campanulata]
MSLQTKSVNQPALKQASCQINLCFAHAHLKEASSKGPSTAMLAKDGCLWACAM